MVFLEADEGPTQAEMSAETVTAYQAMIGVLVQVPDLNLTVYGEPWLLAEVPPHCKTERADTDYLDAVMEETAHCFTITYLNKNWEVRDRETGFCDYGQPQDIVDYMLNMQTIDLCHMEREGG